MRLIYEDGILVETWDDDSRLHTDNTTGVTRPYSDEENESADQALESDSRLSDLEARIARLEALLDPAPGDPTEPTDPSIPEWADLNGVWPNGGLVRDSATVYRNISGVPLTTAPSGFPGDPGRWAHLFIAVFDSVEEPSASWAAGVSYKVGDEVTFSGNRYSCLQEHTSQTGWEPTAVPALWNNLGGI